MRDQAKVTGRERVHLKYQQSRKAEEVGRKGSRTRNSQREEKEKDSRLGGRQNGKRVLP